MCYIAYADIFASLEFLRDVDSMERLNTVACALYNARQVMIFLYCLDISNSKIMGQMSLLLLSYFN